MLMVARMIQGFSGALVWVTGMALLVDTVGREGIGQAASLADMGVTTGTVLAPTLGGLLYENAGYYSVFAISFAIITVDMFLRLALIEKKAANVWLLAESSRRDYGTITGNGPDDGHGRDGSSSSVQKSGQSNDEDQDPLIQPDSDTEAKLMPKTPTTLKLLKSSRIKAALYGLLVQSVVLCSLETVLPIFLNETFGWRAQGGGLTMLAIAIPSVFAPVVGYLSDRYSPRWIAAALYMIAVPALVVLRFVQKPSMGDISLLLVSLVVLGFTVNCVMTPLVVDLTTAVEDFEQDHPEMFQKAGPYARVYGMMVFSFAAGTMLGPILGAYIHRHVDWAALVLFLGLLSASEGLVALLFTDGFILSKRDKGKRAVSAVVARV
ncbi:MAG: hypothetical protein LQ351_007545 [Letrouitia transgressa]|nr:MAG: hypothetical protein LQ351_007545 [Letrouitia transgressa]